MAERIDYPPSLLGDDKNQIKQIWGYLFRTSEILNRNMENTGNNDITERERMAMRGIAGGEDAESIKDMLVSTAKQVQKLISTIDALSAQVRNLTRSVLNAETDEEDLNDILDQGIYWLSISDMTHKPTGIGSGEKLLQVFAGDEAILQRIYSGSTIYTREYRNSSWSGWTAFTAS